MNTYLMGLIAKWASIICLSVAGTLSTSVITEDVYSVNNENKTKNTITTVTNLDYNTKTIYNTSLTKNTKITKQQGKTGLAYKDNKDNIIKVIEEPKEEIIEIGTKEEEIYTGKMTGYGADCAGCSGNLSCRTKNGKSWNLINDGTTYNDEEFGEARILAAALAKFPCGTFIEITNPNMGTFNGIVLDTGGAMRNAYQNGTIWMDLAFTSETSDGIHNSTSTNVKYKVKRWGW
ncbi:MAG: hypothetical protein IKG40_03460 [Bacilli bacterium]|nr:hypothetical protein [Bacilli bacterium]